MKAYTPPTLTVCGANLDRLAARAAVPKYDRSQLSGGILHFGVGNFHRAHQAVYLDDLFNTGRGHDWAIVGAGILKSDQRMRQTLAAQDCLTTVVEQSAESSSASVTGAMIDFVDPGDTAALTARLADPAIRIVSLTITEGGYFIDPATGAFDAGHADIVHDARDPGGARTVFGLLAAGLKARRAAGSAPFTVLSCDNIPHNGTVTRNALVGLAGMSDPALGAWIDASVAFPGSMVDRITPATGDRERALLASGFGIDDAAPVFCEDFRQWVLEDVFSNGRPDLDAVGAQFVTDVAPFEHMKIRMLNGGHATIAYPAGLMDIHFVHEAMADPLIRGFLGKVERDEIIPVVPPVPETDLAAYFRLIEQRFANPKIGDTVRRLCLDGSNRQPKFIVPTIADRLARGMDVTGLALASALWCRYCEGTTDGGGQTAPNDPNWDRLRNAARAAREDPAHWLAMEDVYGEIGRAPRFAKAFAAALNALWTDGTRSVLASYVNGTFASPQDGR